MAAVRPPPWEWLKSTGVLPKTVLGLYPYGCDQPFQQKANPAEGVQ